MPKLKPFPTSKPAADVPTMLTATQLAERLQLSVKQVYAWAAKGQIPAPCIVRVGRSMRFDAAAITSWIDSMRGGALAA